MFFSSKLHPYSHFLQVRCFRTSKIQYISYQKGILQSSLLLCYIFMILWQLYKVQEKNRFSEPLLDSQVPNSSSKLKSHPSFLLLIIKYSNLHPWSAFLLASAWQLLTSARVDKSDYCSAVLEMCVVFLFV